jgi:hypothetical protein
MISAEGAALHMGGARKASTLPLLWIFLVLSLFLNVGFVAWQQIAYDSSSDSSSPGALNVDTDGDGIPDQHDSCPLPSQCTGPMCPPTGWHSGTATDFDSDGCADDSEDKDKDNDGILDLHDQCPYTPQKYAFVSITATDFDGDGCADGIEDDDNDNDSIPNIIDACPLTESGATSDELGCSQQQRELQEKLAELAARLPPHQDIQAGPADHVKMDDSDVLKSKPSRFQEWMDMVQGATIEVVIGAVMSFVLGKIHSGMQQVSSEVTAGSVSMRMSLGVPSQKGSWQSWQPALRDHFFRIAVYLIMVAWLRQNRCSFPEASWFTYGVQAIVGRCALSDP